MEKLLKDDQLYKQYVLQKLTKIEEKLGENCSNIDQHNEDIEKLYKELEDIKIQLALQKECIEKLQKDISFFKKLVAGLISVICSLLGIQIGFQ